MQAEAEGAATARTVEFCGASFRVAEKFGLMPLLRYAHLARAGVGSDDMQGLAASYDVIREAIHPEDWDAFEQHAIACHADEDDIFGVIPKAIELMTARPTSRPSGSSAGPPATSASSRSAQESSPARRAPAGAADLVSVSDLLRSVG